MEWPGPAGGPGRWRGSPPGPARASPARAFLDMDAFARFDLLALNALDIPQIVRTTRSEDRAVERAVQQRADTLLHRVVEDTERPADIARLLHELIRISYKSGLDPASTASWPERAVASWGGLFFESRDPGGRRTARLADRLAWASRGESEPPGPGAFARLRGRAAHVEGSPSLAGAPEQKVLLLETVQSFVDDLVERPLTAGVRVPLPRLSELGRDRGARELNAVLGQLFPLDDDGSFVIVDPRGYPGEPRVVLHRPDDPHNAGEGMFTLSVEAASAPRSALPGDAAPTPAPGSWRDPAKMWDDPSVSPEEWAAVADALHAAGSRLGPPPPGDYRRLPGYVALRRWLLENPTAGPIFESVRWKDRPLGLVLLGRLVTGRSWQPQAPTDSEYLEAELNQLVSGDPERGPADGVWPLRPGWIVRRETAPSGATSYALGPAASA